MKSSEWSRRELLQQTTRLMTGAALLPSVDAVGAARDQAKVAPSDSSAMAALSAYMSDARARRLPDAVVEKVKHHVLDCCAAMISGADLPPGRAALDFARAYGGQPVSTVAASSLRCGPIEAALVNGVMAHADETDDSHAPSS